MRIVKSGKIEEGTKVEKMPGRAWGKGEEISQRKALPNFTFWLKNTWVNVEKKSISTRIHCWARPRFVSNLITAGFSNPSFRVKFESLQFLGRLLSDKK
jgi:hypothetical protein